MEQTNEVELRLRGINIQEQWAEKIYAGEKTIETRKWKAKKYVDGQLMWLIETPDKPRQGGKRTRAEITGVIRFGNATEYSSYQEWENDFTRHCVPSRGKWNWDPQESKMFAWEIVEARRLATPIDAPIVRGMVGSKHHSARVVFKL